MKNELTHNPLENENSIYSVGTGIALDSLLKNYIDYPYGLIMINIGTLVRNLIVKEDTVQSVFAKFTSELPTMLNEITELMRSIRSINNPVIFLYNVDYPKCIDVDSIRKPSASRFMLFECLKYIHLHNDRLFGKTGNGVVNGVDVLYRHINKSNISISTQLFNNVSGKTTHRNAIMMSHIATDFHISIKFKKFIILESHTGKWKKTYEMNKKVFGDRYASIPFYPITHTCLGDKNILKPHLGIAQKKELLELASKDNWRTKSEYHISSMIDMKFHLKSKV